MVTVLLKKMYSNPLGKMVIQLSICGLLLALSAIIQDLVCNSEPPDQDSLSLGLYYVCHFLLGFGASGTLVWACCFAHCLYYIGKEGSEEFLQSQHKIYTKTSYLIGFISAILNCLAMFYLISEENESEVFLMFFWILVLVVPLISFIINLIYYIKGLKLAFLRRNHIPWILLIYPGALAVCNLPKSLVMLYIYIKGLEYTSTVVEIIVESLWLLQGMLNALVYGLTSGINEAMREQCCQDTAKGSQYESCMETQSVYYSHNTIQIET